MTLTRDDITYIKGRLQSAGPAWLRLQLRLALETLEARHMVGGVEVEAREFRDHVYVVTGTKTKKQFDEWCEVMRGLRPLTLPGRIPVVADSRVTPGDVILVKRAQGVVTCDPEEEQDGGYVDRDPVRLPAKGELP